MATWQNWAGNVDCAPQQIVRPHNEADVVEALARAEAQGVTVRVAGSGHSFTPLVATDGMLLDLSELRGIARMEAEHSRAWVRAGTKLSELGELLFAEGFAMENLGDVDVQALGGALGTGTHGTGPELPNLSARVSGLRILRTDGELRSVRDDTDPEGLRAARVSLGALGVITAARIDLVPAFRLHERVERLPVEAILESLDERIAATRHFEFFWYPQADRAEAKSLHPTDEPVDDFRIARANASVGAIASSHPSALSALPKWNIQFPPKPDTPVSRGARSLATAPSRCRMAGRVPYVAIR